MTGRNCDNCDAYLNEEDYEEYGSWSYTCPECGFKYRHSIELSASEQVKKFLVKEEE